MQRAAALVPHEDIMPQTRSIPTDQHLIVSDAGVSRVGNRKAEVVYFT
jgi:hypothetical protein